MAASQRNGAPEQACIKHNILNPQYNSLNWQRRSVAAFPHDAQTYAIVSDFAPETGGKNSATTRAVTERRQRTENAQAQPQGMYLS